MAIRLQITRYVDPNEKPPTKLIVERVSSDTQNLDNVKTIKEKITPKKRVYTKKKLVKEEIVVEIVAPKKVRKPRVKKTAINEPILVQDSNAESTEIEKVTFLDDDKASVLDENVQINNINNLEIINININAETKDIEESDSPKLSY